MKRYFFTLLMMFCFSGFVMAQKAFETGTKTLQLGGGIGLAGIYGDPKTPPITAMFDFALNDNFSLGVAAGYAGSEFLYPPLSINGKLLEYGFNYSYTVIGTRLAYHISNSEKFDIYFGGLLGYTMVSASVIWPEEIDFILEPKASGSYLLYGGFAGLRLFFNQNIGFYIEGGYGLSLVNGGLAFKF